MVTPRQVLGPRMATLKRPELAQGHHTEDPIMRAWKIDELGVVSRP
jgi:hypothetical protein